MRKEFQGQKCSYCRTKPATTDDHVIARGFLPSRLRGYLPKVPACAACNTAKSDLERYACSVFPFGSMHRVSREILQTEVGRKLEKDQRLSRELAGGMKDVTWVTPDGAEAETVGLPLDPEKLRRLLRLIVKGLLRYRNGRALPTDYFVRELFLTDAGLDVLKQTFRRQGLMAWQQESFADGAFEYEWVPIVDDPFHSVWHVDIYGRLLMTGTTESGEAVLLHMVAITGPPELAYKVYSIEFENG